MILAISHHQAPRTGAHGRFDRLVACLAKNHSALVWLTPSRADMPGISSDQTITLQIAGGRSSAALRLLHAVVRRRRQLRSLRGKVSLVVTFGETNLLAALIVSRLVAAPLSVGVRSNVPRRNREIRARMAPSGRILSYARAVPRHVVLSLTYWKACQIVVQTAHAAREFCENYRVRPEKIKVLENDIPPDFRASSRREELPERPRRLLYIGNSSHIKGFDVLSNALEHIDRHVVAVREITLVGVSNALYNAQEFDRIELRVIEKTTDIIELMRTHDLLVVPSREDQFPNVVLEALGMGLPVIGGHVDGIEHMLKDPFVLFAPGSVESLLAGLMRVSTPEGYARAKWAGLAARKRFEFDWEAKYQALLERAICDTVKGRK